MPPCISGRPAWSNSSFSEHERRLMAGITGDAAPSSCKPANITGHTFVVRFNIPGYKAICSRYARQGTVLPASTGLGKELHESMLHKKSMKTQQRRQRKKNKVHIQAAETTRRKSEKGKKSKLKKDPKRRHHKTKYAKDIKNKYCLGATTLPSNRWESPSREGVV